MQELVLKKLLAKKKVGKVAKAQLKITAIIIYYTILGVVGLVAYTYFEAADTIKKGVTEYILCESVGVSDVSDCALEEETVALEILAASVVMMLGFLPVMIVIFSCDPKAYKRKAKKPNNKNFTRSKTSSTQI